MAGHYLRKRLRSAPVARRMAWFSGILLVVSALMLRLGAVEFAVFEILLALVATIGGAALVLAGFGLQRVWSRGHEGGAAALGAFVVGLFVAAPFALGGALALSNPPINMAETDGLAEAVDEPAPVDPAAVVNGRVFPVRASQMYQTVRLVLGDVGWSVSGVETADPKPVAEDTAEPPEPAPAPPVIAGGIPVPTPRVAPDEEAGEGEADPLDRPESGEYRVTAEARDPILRLPSDVEIRITEDEEQAYLDLRSVSRFGSRDLGQNRRFIENFLERVDAAMIGATSTPKG